MDVERVGDAFVYVTSDDESLPAWATVREPEGRSVVLARDDADAFGLSHDVVLAWLTVSAQTSLTAVGITASISAALAAIDCPCNVIAGHHHDHVVVPIDRVDDATAALGAIG